MKMIIHSEEEDCDNEFQTAVSLSGSPGHQGWSFFTFFAFILKEYANF